MLPSNYPTCQHVENTGLPIPAKDQEIWKWAKAKDYMIVTNDEDFLNLLMQKGFPPKIILLRTGNQSTQQVAKVLTHHKDDIQALWNSNEYGVLEIY